MDNNKGNSKEQMNLGEAENTLLLFQSACKWNFTLAVNSEILSALAESKESCRWPSHL